MAVNSKADKRHALTSNSIQSQVGVRPGTPTTPTPYTAAPPAPPATGMSPVGQKALQARAKKELAPLSDPTQSIAE